ncbi:mannose-1-phosphate guanylyltransferase/mannose-6-phosphate isomerase [Vibrio cholerae]|uniref:mannose-1-phosphate guanylyltransferase/mannose-6-phosphate isomerase n=1 Tax=Vibrio cholerae TaxID=666 RepID=UPI000E0AB322|nr:mannose-1-phosphate guanylyltransferase/mannose-6-phosphate isomerase [Vibrio cholerae]TQP24667.1 mannose-1-phosphate guanylyltransferase/mannose-6-phosphate isomerase [Vibrio cholerae]GHY15078.1 mannose-1-phosphate guanylyltransferase [Vibrio cholerae]GIA33614.1 mannose-1-phosphate guanylyltransferase [Vibrio cholerae]
MILPVIMAGGSGSRLWPLSRGNFPKQFLSLSGKATMLQNTICRLSGINHLPAMLICNEEHRFIAAEQIRQLGVKHSGILLEPIGRNTAPAIGLAAFKAVELGQDPLLLVLPADHVIENVDVFQQSVNRATELAQAGKLVTFGIVGNKPETGYGYIKRGDSCQYGYIVDGFVEKPNLTTAKEYIASGDYYWNSGIFLFKASRYLAELKAYRPDIYSACELAMRAQNNDIDFIRIDKPAFEACPDDSIDYAVMEHTNDAVVVPMDAGWSDVGGFAALWEVSAKDDDGNVFNGDVKSVDTKNTLVFGGNKLVTTVGVEDLVIVNTKDAVLVAHKDQSQHVNAIVGQLKSEQRSEVTFHREVYRPWGKYDSIDNGDRFQVKRITVKPGAKLSVQMHHHRAEHWIVVSGTAKVTNGDRHILLTENQSTYIPVGVIHALENPGKVDLELIEVQSGSYLGEDDIVRFEDRYGRVEGK